MDHIDNQPPGRAGSTFRRNLSEMISAMAVIVLAGAAAAVCFAAVQLARHDWHFIVVLGFITLILVVMLNGIFEAYREERRGGSDPQPGSRVSRGVHG
jgi:hypothetical protein